VFGYVFGCVCECTTLRFLGLLSMFAQFQTLGILSQYIDVSDTSNMTERISSSVMYNKAVGQESAINL